MKIKKTLNYELDKSKGESIQAKALKLLAGFLVLMILLTVISRAADSLTIARVSTVNSRQMSIDHTIKGDGTIAANKSIAISTVDGVKVASINVNEGSSVKKGDVLFTLDETDLKEKLLKAEQDLTLLDKQAADANYNESVAQQKKQEAINQAYVSLQNQYEDIGETVDAAAREVTKAQEKLDKYKSTHPDAEKNPIEEDTVYKNLLTHQEQTASWKADAQRLYDGTIQELTTAINQARNTFNDTTGQYSDAGMQACYAIELASMTKRAEAAGEAMTETQKEDAKKLAYMRLLISTFDVEESTPANTENIGEGIDASNGYSELNTVKRNLTTESLGLSAAYIFETPFAAVDNYTKKYQDAKKELDKRTQEADEAAAAVTAYSEDYKKKNPSTADPAELEALTEALASAEEVYAKAVNDQNKQIERANESYNQTLSGLNEPQSADSATEYTKMNEYELAELKVQKYKTVQAAGGQVKATVDGIVTGIQITTGEATSEGTAVMLADRSGGYKFTASLTKENAKLLSRGDALTLDLGVSGNSTVDVNIDSIEQDAKDTSQYKLIASIPAGTENVGLSASMTIDKKSDKYPVVVPNSVVRSRGGSGGQSENYVLVINESDGILGTSTTVERVTVEVLDKNDEWTAISGAFSTNSKFVTTSNKTIESGDRVRLNEE